LRVILTWILAPLIIGTSAGATVGLNTHARELLTGIFEDVGAILNSFAGGPDDPTNPVTNQATLKEDAARLDSATRQANQLATELNNLVSPKEDRGH
jgi:hypothetical protein